MVELVCGLHHVSSGGDQGKSGMVELLCGLHHVSSGGEKWKFLSGGANARASP